MLLACEGVSSRRGSRISSYQGLCPWSRSRKIRRLLGFSSAVEIYFKNATDGLDRGESEIQPFPPVTNHCRYECFSWLAFWNNSVPINSASLFFCHMFLWDEIPCHSYLFPQLGDSYKGRWFSSNMELDSAGNATLRLPLGSWSFLYLPFVALRFRKVMQPPRWIFYRKQTSSPWITWTPSF